MKYLSFFTYFIVAVCITQICYAKNHSNSSPYYAAISAGVTDIFDDGREGQFGLEILGNKYYSYFKPKLGLHVTSKQAKYFYTGVNFEYQIPATNFEGVLGLAAGYYNKGKSKHLGHDLEFKSTVGINYLLPKNFKSGVSFIHLSDAHLSNRNPGTEDISLNLSVPV